MIDLGEFIPTTSTPPTRDPSGNTTLGRVTVTEEQRLEAVAALVAVAQEKNEDVVRATIRWSNFDPTILEVTTIVEHLDGKRIRFVDVVEMLPSGAEIPSDEEHRVRTLIGEVADLHEKKTL